MKLPTALALMLLLGSMNASAIIMTVDDYTDLDFSGGFVYALNFGGGLSATILDASFTNVASDGAGAPAGVSLSGFNAFKGHGLEFGTEPENDALENIVNYAIWGNGIDSGAIDLSIIAGTAYRLQLLFSESSSDDRHFDISAENGAFQEEVLGVELGGSVWRYTFRHGYAMVWDFAAGDAVLDIDFTRNLPGDTNYLISGLTLERFDVPEPGTIGLFAAGLAGLGWSRRKKA